MIGDDRLADREAGLLPYFTHVREDDDGFGVRTSYFCSPDCVKEYLEQLNGGED